MRRLICLFLIALTGNVMSCARDSGDELKLSRDEAKAIIQKEEGYPKPVGDLQLGARAEIVVPIIKKLIDSGYIESDLEEKENVYGIRGIRTQIYLPTEKGKANIEKIRLIYRGESLQSSAFHGSVAVADIREIKEIVIDRESGVATVRYVLHASPVEPLYEMLCSAGVDCGHLQKLKPGEIRLKRIDKVWKKENDTPSE
jgi:hypothetical protein